MNMHKQRFIIANGSSITANHFGLSTMYHQILVHGWHQFVQQFPMHIFGPTEYREQTACRWWRWRVRWRWWRWRRMHDIHALIHFHLGLLGGDAEWDGCWLCGNQHNTHRTFHFRLFHWIQSIYLPIFVSSSSSSPIESCALWAVQRIEWLRKHCNANFNGTHFSVFFSKVFVAVRALKAKQITTHWHEWLKWLRHYLREQMILWCTDYCVSIKFVYAFILFNCSRGKRWTINTCHAVTTETAIRKKRKNKILWKGKQEEQKSNDELSSLWIFILHTRSLSLSRSHSLPPICLSI